MTKLTSNMTNTTFRNNLNKLAKGWMDRLELIDSMTIKALVDINKAGNNTNLTALITTEAISSFEKKALRYYLLEAFNIEKVYLSKSKTGAPVAKVKMKEGATEIEKVEPVVLLSIGKALKEQEKQSNPFDEEHALKSLYTLAKRCTKAGIDFKGLVSKVLK